MRKKRICTEYRVYNRAQYSMRIWKIYAHKTQRKIEFTYQSQKTLNLKVVLDRGHEMFHDDMIMYANINDQQPIIAMITRSSP